MNDEKHPNKVLDNDGRTLKAGGIVVRQVNGDKYIAMMYRPECDDWTFPKGHVEKGEDAYKASIREIKEEVGIDVSNGIELPDEIYTNEKNPNGIIVKMFLYESSIEQLTCKDDECEPHWVPIVEVENKLSYKNLKIFFRSIKKNIEDGSRIASVL